MSRLHSFLSAGLPISPVSGLVEDPQVVQRHLDSEGVGIADTGPSICFPHRLFVPEHYESAYDYPLFVWLHSDHSSEYELDHVMHSLSLRNYVGVALRGNRLSTRSEQVFRWGSNLTDYALNEECIFHAIDQIASSMSIDTSRIFLGGFGKGATLAQWVGLRNPHQIAGVVACNGPFPSNKRALALWKQARGLPVLAMQSSDSKVFGVDQIITMMKTAHRGGLNYRLMRFESPTPAPFDKTSSPNHGNEDPEFEGSLEVDMLQAANRFMMGIVTGTDIPLVPETLVPEQSLWLQ
jgi:phospholipase/carboxylesterase